MEKLRLAVVVAVGVLTATCAVHATTSVIWTAPPNGSVYPVGTLVTPVGQAGASGAIGGTGLDLALVIDTSGSMSASYSGKTLIQWAAGASIALINALPEASTAVTIVTFDSDANVYRQLAPLTGNKSALIAAVNSLDAPGYSTAIGSGIEAAAGELTSARHTAGHSQQMVVLSDGYNNDGPPPLTSAANAITAGVDAIHTVGVPGHDPVLMGNIAAGPDGSPGTADDRGVYTSVNDLTTLEGIFSGTSGNLVGLDRVEVTTPDGTTQVVPTDGLGNFAAPAAYAIQSGSQSWTATAYGTDQTSAAATLTLLGQSGQNGGGPSGVPDAGSSLLLLGFGLLGTLVASRKRSN